MTVLVRNINRKGGEDEAEMLKVALSNQQDGKDQKKIEKEGETEDKVAIPCAGGKREFKQNMKKELFA